MWCLPRAAARAFAFAFTVGAVLVFSAGAWADPPSRAARLGHVSGAVSFSPAGEADWVQATVNRPLTPGDRLWAEAGARAEIQIGGAMVRLAGDTGVSILNFDDQVAQLQVTQGRLNVRVRRLASGQVFEVNTPNLALALQEPGDFRIEVDPERDETTIFMRRGSAQAYGDGQAFAIEARQPYRFTGTDLHEVDPGGLPRPDEFDAWSSSRDRAFDSSVSARYVSPDVLGYQDLDANGTWRVDATYGNVWMPSRVAAGWAPFRDGHWAWIDPWGWTWIDDAPWGFAVSHYGRWAHIGGSWGWVPGPPRSPAYYAPALVVFVGGANFQLAIGSGNVGGVAWFPLGPREVYRPSYPVSRGYFENVNRSNTVVDNSVINNTYNVTNVTNIVYANRRVPGAVVAVPTAAFVQSQPVSRAAVRVEHGATDHRPGEPAPPVAPTARSVHGAAAERDRPPARVFERTVIARTAPAAAHAGFAAQQEQLSARPGRPLDDATRRQLKPAAAAPAPAVKVVVAPQEDPRAPRAPVADAAKPTARGERSEQDRQPQRQPQRDPAQPRGPLESGPMSVPRVQQPAAPAASAPARAARQEPPRAQGRPAVSPEQAPAKEARPREAPARAPGAVTRPAPVDRAGEPQARARGPSPAASRPQERLDDRDDDERDKDKRKPRD
jgi:FecR protein